MNRRRVVTLEDGVPGERSISVACMHCTDAPCAAVCPVDCFYTTDDGIVLHDKDLCIGCGYCFYACPFGAPQYPQKEAFGVRGKMDKCTFCAGGPEGKDNSDEERKKYGKNRIAEGKLPLCAEMRHEGPDRRRRRHGRGHLPRARHEAQRPPAILGLARGVPGGRVTARPGLRAAMLVGFSVLLGASREFTERVELRAGRLQGRRRPVARPAGDPRASAAVAGAVHQGQAQRRGGAPVRETIR